MRPGDMIGQNVKIQQKTVTHTPLLKLQDAFINVLASGHGVVEINRRVKPDSGLLPAFGRSPYTDQSDVSHTDFTNQVLYSHHYWTDEGKLRTFSAPFRWVWPAELDLMARLAGMTLRERWAGWRRQPFSDESDAHVSVWEKLPSDGF
jgi:hypothetical protein